MKDRILSWMNKPVPATRGGFAIQMLMNLFQILALIALIITLAQK